MKIDFLLLLVPFIATMVLFSKVVAMQSSRGKEISSSSSSDTDPERLKTIQKGKMVMTERGRGRRNPSPVVVEEDEETDDDDYGAGTSKAKTWSRKKILEPTEQILKARLANNEYRSRQREIAEAKRNGTFDPIKYPKSPRGRRIKQDGAGPERMQIRLLDRLRKSKSRSRKKQEEPPLWEISQDQKNQSYECFRRSFFKGIAGYSTKSAANQSQQYRGRWREMVRQAVEYLQSLEEGREFPRDDGQEKVLWTSFLAQEVLKKDKERKAKAAVHTKRYEAKLRREREAMFQEEIAVNQSMVQQEEASHNSHAPSDDSGDSSFDLNVTLDEPDSPGRDMNHIR